MGARNWQLALLLAAAGGVAGAAVVPYLRVVVPGHAPLAVAMAATAVQTAILCFLVAWAGLAAGRGIGLDAPLLRAWRDGTAAAAGTRRSLVVAGVMGALAGAVIVALALLLPHPVAPAGLRRWQGLLASFYGGIVEEVQMRLFVMTLLARLLLLGSRHKQLSPPRAWIAIVLATLAFGAGHLPVAAKLGALTPMIVAQVLLFNGVAGVVFGWLFWRRGLEHAMVAHFTADLVLHVLVA